jgi:hypothetical protein
LVFLARGEGGGVTGHLQVLTAICFFTYHSLGTTTNDARYPRQNKSRTDMVKGTFNKTFFTSKLDFNLSKKPVYSHTWSITLYCAEIWTLWKDDQKNRVSFEMRCWRKMEKICWTDRVRNEEA